jgi:hypothetical protein
MSSIGTFATSHCADDVRFRANRTLSRHRRTTEFDPQLVIRKHSLDSPIGLGHRPRDGSVVSFPNCMNGPQPEGSHGKPHRTTKILSDAWRRGSRLAARGKGGAASEGARHRIPWRGQGGGFARAPLKSARRPHLEKGQIRRANVAFKVVLGRWGGDRVLAP